MAKVSLRIYNREIESLVDQGHNNEAIAHCHHILRTFPKHLATYRLLGKAHLELKRYAEAVDVFSRLLMAVPDDFVAHVGMSIIRDEENKFDDAIWHMERAFETQSSNAAIQGELQRLYGRRDGMEPPRIRMTRGALSHLYVQGELYPQAVAEIRAVLSQEPDRADMQVLLARAYFRGGQKADASDMCAQLLKRYSYCFDANRIMVDLLPATAGVAESTQVYRMRVGEMDPYATFAKGSVFLSDEVADAAINLERLEYKEESEPAGQPWTPALGLGSGAAASAATFAAASSSEPDWLKAGSSPEPSPQVPAAGTTDELPDFLRQAGWGASTSPEQPSSIFDEEPAGNLTPAEIPDWLRGQEPAQAAPPPPVQPKPAQAVEVPDWLLDNSQAAGQTSDIPDWLKDTSQPEAETPPMDHTAAWLSSLDEKPAAAEPAQAASDAPDWLSGLDNQQPAEPAQAAGDVPDWLSGLDNQQTVEPAQSAGNVPDWLSGLDNQQPEPAQATSDVPDWLGGLDNQQPAQPASDVPDWLSGLDNQQPVEPAQPASDIPDWLSGLDSQSEQPAAAAPAIESLGATAQEQDDAVAWLESLAAKHGAKPEELVTDPNKRSEKPPEWVAQAQNLGQEAPAPAPTASVESLGSTAQEQDDAVAWLESLAAKHGAKPEELVTDPNKRSEKPPEWVAQAQNLGQEAPAPAPAPAPTPAPVASVESLGATAQEQDDAVAWLESLAAKHGAKPEELVTDPNKRSEKPPEWVAQAQSIGEAQPAEPAHSPDVVENALNIGEQFFAEFESASTAPPMDPTSAWLRSLDEEEEKQTQQVQPSTGESEWFAETKPEPEPLQRSEIPEWLSDVDSQAEEGFEFPQKETQAESNSLPDWFEAGKTEPEPIPQSEARSEMSEGDLANWLNSLDDEPGLPFDSVPSPDAILFASQAKPAPKPKAVEPAQPEWLSEVDSQEAEEEVEMVRQEENLPDWLRETDEETEFIEDDDTPPWQHRARWEAGESQQPKPTAPSDWHPLEPKQVEKPAPKPEAPVVEAHKPFVPPPPEPVAQPVAPVPQAAAPAKKKTGLPARKPSEGTNVIAALNQAKNELDRGDIPAALAHYGKLIKKGKHIEETIRDLTESIYRYPVEVGIWQTLGDAYMRANRLKEALEAYNKAEELIR